MLCDTEKALYKCCTILLQKIYKRRVLQVVYSTLFPINIQKLNIFRFVEVLFTLVFDGNYCGTVLPTIELTLRDLIGSQNGFLDLHQDLIICSHQFETRNPIILVAQSSSSLLSTPRRRHWPDPLIFFINPSAALCSQRDFHGFPRSLVL